MRITSNKFGVRIGKCCASCRFKESTRLMMTRHCTKLNKEVDPLGVCECWKMSRQLSKLEFTRGKVKRREYLLYLTDVRVKEQELEDKGEKVVPKSIDEIRAQFEKEHGSIYMNI